ncbi:MAG: substrate-binding domain-containing protein, partial [Solirubrobacterales bacterium]|nr:substrate-binding domain-containing protein [Solirubrobacterales bacterium]
MGTGANHGAPRRYALWLASLLAVAIAAFAIGCGSDDDGGSDTSGGSADNGGTTEVVAAAEEVIAPYMEPPESVGTDVELSEPAPGGKKIVALSCALDVCKAWRDDVAEAAEAIGWSATGQSFDGTPEDTLAKVTAAVNSGADAIVINGVPRETYEAAVEQAKSKGVPIVTQMGELEGEVVDPFIAVQYQADEFDRMANATGNWVIADGNGESNALVLSYANFPLSERIADKTKEAIDENCPDCQTKALRVQAADTGTKLPAAVVSEIQRDPSITHVVFQDAAMAGGVDAALREAGLTDKVKVLGNNTTPQALQAACDGINLGWMSFSTKAAAWAGIDALARHYTGDEIVYPPLMNQILTQETMECPPGRQTGRDLPPDLP